MLIRYGYEIEVICARPTPLICLMSVQVDRLQDLCMPETATATPFAPMSTYHDSYGNLCPRLVAPAGEIVLKADATIRDGGGYDPVFPDADESPVESLPNEILLYLLGSRYCETDKLSQAAWDLFGHLPPGWSRVQAICDFVHAHIAFDYQKASSTRSAYETFQERVGVCRDFAHLAVAFCRCMNIPARYVNGHLGDIGVPVVDPMDFSAWIEVYIGGGWKTFDPRNNTASNRTHRRGERARCR